MFVLVLAIAAISAPLVAGYDEVYDQLDVDKMLTNDALLDEYLDCFLDKAPCKPQYSADFKKILPELIAEACGKCTPIQKANTRTLFAAVQERKPNKALEVLKKFDPKGEHQTKFAVFLTGKDK